jgi:hypothetical protein
MEQRMSGTFDRPVFILGAPRSCSTLLFQTLCGSAALCSIGDESHAIFEGHRKLSPGRGAVDSNRFDAQLLDPALARSIRERFATRLRNRDGEPVVATGGTPVRMLEKTPKNCLRVPFLDALFPDALFVYLYRDARRNISSIMDAWRSGRFATYRGIRTAHGPWSLLLPPGWQDQVDRPLEEIAAFQWQSANEHVIQDMAKLPRTRWITMNADELLECPPQAMERLAAFIGIGVDSRWRSDLQRPLPESRYTLSAPQDDKWQRNAVALQRIWPGVARTIARINAFVGPDGRALDTAAPELPADAQPEPGQFPGAGNPAAAVSRNQPCPCGSGKRYKACHGNAS